MAEDVTLLDLSFKTDEAVEGLDALIKKSLDLAEEETANQADKRRRRHLPGFVRIIKTIL